MAYLYHQYTRADRRWCTCGGP